MIHRGLWQNIQEYFVPTRACLNCIRKMFWHCVTHIFWASVFHKSLWHIVSHWWFVTVWYLTGSLWQSGISLVVWDVQYFAHCHRQMFIRASVCQCFVRVSVAIEVCDSQCPEFLYLVEVGIGPTYDTYCKNDLSNLPRFTSAYRVC